MISDKKTPLGCGTLPAAREDPTSPRSVKNGLDASGYVGQAARPPRFAPCEAARLETLSGAEEPRAKALGYGV